MELRWHPFLEEWVAIAAHRQERPHLPENWCPFCPGSGDVPKEYDVFLYHNDFPTFRLDVPELSASTSSLYKAAKSVGVCDVVLYHPDHTKQLGQLELNHIMKIIRLWQTRFRELAERTEIKYVFIFENKGAAIGVTIHHPHGQVYAFPYIPPKIETELQSTKKYFESNKRCLFCDIIAEELRDSRRIVAENTSFVASVPFYARWPYEVHIHSKRHFQTITELTDQEATDFASVLKIMAQKYDNLFGFTLPYTMVMHQAPPRGREPTDSDTYPFYHFHVEFYPPNRSEKKLKYLAGCESGAGTFINDTIPEETAARLRDTSPTSDK